MVSSRSANEIGTLNEKPLHAALKEWYAQPGDQIEVELDGYFIDIVRDDLLIEIQTRNFSAIKRKVTDLIKAYPLRLVYPIAQEKWIIKQSADSAKMTRRKSPKRGQPLDVFKELVSFPALLDHENFSLEVVMIQEEEVRRYTGKTNWRRRGWVTDERRLISVVERYHFQTPREIWSLIPADLPNEFTTTNLAALMGINKRFARQVAYCLRKMGIVEQIGKRGRLNLYHYQD